MITTFPANLETTPSQFTTISPNLETVHSKSITFPINLETSLSKSITLPPNLETIPTKSTTFSPNLETPLPNHSPLQKAVHTRTAFQSFLHLPCSEFLLGGFQCDSCV